MDFDSILAELADCAKAPSPAEVEISPEAVTGRAKEMALSGYEPSKASLTALELYLKGYGLWLDGGVGTGKTMFFRRMRPSNIPVKRTGEIPSIVVFSMPLTLGMDMDDVREFLEEHRYDELVLDDVGAEPVFNYFGGKMELLPYLLEKRMESPCRTHITTNLTPKALGERYGARTLDRVVGMFKRVTFTGKSHRAASPNTDILQAQLEVISRRQRVAATQKPARSNETAPRSASRGRDGKTVGPDAANAPRPDFDAITQSAKKEA